MNTYRELVSPAITATVNHVLGPIDIKDFVKISVISQNKNVTVTVVHQLIEVAFDSSGSDTPSNWQALNTAIYPYPCAVATAAVAPMTSEANFENTWNWMRITVRTSSTAIAGSVVYQVGGQGKSGKRGDGFTGSEF